MNIVKTSNTEQIKELFKDFIKPQSTSHKGQNGKVLIIGGSKLFHAASLWSAEVASHFVDMVHYASTPENNEIMLALKTIFRNGIVVHQTDVDRYVQEDDAILIGPGMMREGEEGKVSRQLNKGILTGHPRKKFVLDAGALQTLDTTDIDNLLETPILTPHQGEFKMIFGIDMTQKSLEEKASIVEQRAKKHHCVILFKAIDDIISDGETTYVVQGGNAGLTKGGTGDVLAGITVALRTKHSAGRSALFASILLKRTAENLAITKGSWYNVSDIINDVPVTVTSIV